jgi:ferrous iron transport protein B
MVLQITFQLGVVGLMTTMFFGVWSILVIIVLFTVAILHLIFTAWLFNRKLLKKDGSCGLIMELPPYHKPNWKVIWSTISGRLKGAAKKMFIIVMIISVVVWAFSYSSGGDIENSILYDVGTFIEPVTMLFGMSWILFFAFLISGLGKEASLGALAMMYGLGQNGQSIMGIHSPSTSFTFDESVLEGILLADVSQASALAFIFAFFFNIPCLMTIATAHTEINSKKFTAFVTVYYMGMALAIGALAYYVGLVIF